MKEFSIPSGMRDLIGTDAKSKQDLKYKIEQNLDRWGYDEIVTPSIEFYQTYENAFSDLQEEDVYKFFDSNGRILALRADMTVPIARVVATKFKKEPVVKLRYCANVFKVHKTLSGNRNEITDCGVEFIGQDKKTADLEILVCALSTLKAAGDFKFTLEVGDINFFQKALNYTSLRDEEKKTLAYFVDNKSMIELKEYLNGLQLEDNMKNFFYQLVLLSGDCSVLQKAKEYAFNQELKDIIHHLEHLYQQLCTLGYHEYISFDLGKVGNWNYYTGLIFDAFVAGVGLRVMSGGRYDNLLHIFGRNLPAVGFSIKLDQLVKVVQPEPSHKKIYLYYPEEKQIEALKLRDSFENSTIVMVLDATINDIKVREEV